MPKGKRTKQSNRAFKSIFKNENIQVNYKDFFKQTSDLKDINKIEQILRITSEGNKRYIDLIESDANDIYL